MKIISFSINGARSIGIQLENGVMDFSAALQAYELIVRKQMITPVTDMLTLLKSGRFDSAFFQEVLTFAEEARLLERFLIQEPVLPLLPFRPPKIVSLGPNFTGHATEAGFEPPKEPIFFSKASTCVIGPEEPIQIKKKWGRVDPEVELAVVIGKTAKNLMEEDARQYIAGYSIMNDVSARAMQFSDIEKTSPWYRSKSIDTFGPFGPCVVTADEISWPVEVDMKLAVNGTVRQRDNTGNQLFSISRIIAYVTDMITLEPGDVISTGTPEGISEIFEGDVVECCIEGIGILRNPVVAALVV